ncbi:MAG: glutathione S-transferase [Proteobacteria bacterium]|nr:glutathione S-transferase [Pseudomonadota bacterium]
MSDGRIVIGTRRYSSWSMRGWLPVALAGLDVTEVVIPLAEGETSAVRGQTPSGLVPYLEHNGARIWESLAIIEYCAEFDQTLWPKKRRARAMARAAAAEMHAGFRALRQAMPMNLGRDDFAGLGQTPAALADIARIEALWAEAREEFGEDGPYLFGERFTGADIMFAPVVARLLTYAPPLSETSQDYCRAVRAQPQVDAWYRAAAEEPQAWQLEKYESVRTDHAATA